MLDNIDQGVLSVDLISAHDLMAADKTGTSDPYVVFTVNGERMFKSEVIKKTLNPKWDHAKFTVPIVSILLENQKRGKITYTFGLAITSDSQYSN